MGKETIYFTDVDSRPVQRLAFQYLPKVITQNRAVNLVTVNPVGKSLPSYHGTGGELTMDLELSWTPITEDRADLMRKLKWLEARTYFNVNRNPLHRLQVVFGDMINIQLWVIKSLTIDYSIFQLNRGNLPNLAIAKITLGQWAEATYTAEDVMSSFRSPAATQANTLQSTPVDLSGAQANREAGQTSQGTAADLTGVQANKDARNRLEAAKQKNYLPQILNAYSAIQLGRAVL